MRRRTYLLTSRVFTLTALMVVAAFMLGGCQTREAQWSQETLNERLPADYIPSSQSPWLLRHTERGNVTCQTVDTSVSDEADFRTVCTRF